MGTNHVPTYSQPQNQPIQISRYAKINANGERAAITEYENILNIQQNLKHITLSGMAKGLLPHSAKALSQVIVARA